MERHTNRPYPTEALPHLLTTREVAEVLAVSVRTVRRLGRDGALTPVRVGGSVRYRPQDVAAMIDHEVSRRSATRSAGLRCR